MKIEEIYRRIVIEKLGKEILVEIDEGKFEEQIRYRATRMIAGIEDLKVENGMRIKGNSWALSEEAYQKYKNIDVPVEGYLVYELVGHTGEYWIRSKDDLKQVEQEILSPSGLSNMFTTELLVLAEGEVKRYTAIDGMGRRVTKEQLEAMDIEEVQVLKIIWGE